MTIQSFFDNPEKKFILVGGKGGTGKTSTACSLAVKFASSGMKTLIISTDPAHSISDSLDVDLSGGDKVEVPGFDGMLFGIEVDAQNAGESFSEILGMSGADEEAKELYSTLNSMGFDEFQDLLETAPPGIDEAVALAKVIQFLESEEYQDFEKIVFDTAPTGHTLRLLALPEFLDNFLYKAMRVRSKMGNMFNSFKALFGAQPKRDTTVDALEELKKLVIRVKAFFQNELNTEFMVVSIPTIMSIKESERLVEELENYSIAVNNLVVNQIMPENVDCTFCMARSRNQKANLDYVRESFKKLDIIEVPYFDREIRGVDGLKYMSEYLV